MHLCPTSYECHSSRVPCESLCQREGARRLRQCLRCLDVPAELREHGCPLQRMRHAKGMREPARQRVRLLAPHEGLGWIAQQPEDPGGMDQTADPGVMSTIKRRLGVVVLDV